MDDITAKPIELNGQYFTPVEPQLPEDWPNVERDRPHPTFTLKDNDLFLVADSLGNISGVMTHDVTASMGLFCADTRFLSRLDLQISGRTPVLLSSTAEKGFILTVLCTNPQIDSIPTNTVGIRREMVLNGGLFEEIELHNYGTQTITFQLSLSFNVDFVDLFEVRWGAKRDRRGQRLQHQHNDIHPNKLIMAYQGVDGSLMESRIEFLPSRLPDTIRNQTAVWNLELSPQGQISIGYRLSLFTNNNLTTHESPDNSLAQAKAAELLEQQEWQAQSTHIRTDNDAINQMLQCAEQDIHLLMQSFEKGKTLSAGVPWFSTLFGRDSLISATQMLMLNPAIARDTLLLLAHYQSQGEDPRREAEPGKIPHELRLGEMARCQEIPHTPYYGTIDATPLWLMLYSDYYAWTADRETLEQLWPNAIAAMDWIDRNCAATDGYLRYGRQSPEKGLQNLGWKDSAGCIVNRLGQQPDGPIALCEVQAYVYAAKTRLSAIALASGRHDLAERWSAEAARLKMHFNQDFWVEDLDFCALALDSAGNPIDGITSNPGHCLSLGILEPSKALKVAARLREPDMFSGWGIRTLSQTSPAYNPMGYHMGAVWPHDNSIVVLGLRSLGLVEQSLELTQGLFDMTLAQPYARPPELFCGYERRGDSEPVRYPVACSPQAWATGSIFQLLQGMANLVPDAPNNCIRIVHPALPQSIKRLTLHNLRVGSTLLDLDFERFGATTACRVSKKQGSARVVIEA
jgi:glycogen debranching enzyme